MPNEIRIDSTTETKEQVEAALGMKPKEKEATKDPAKEPEKDEKAKTKADEPAKPDAEADDDDESVDDEAVSEAARTLARSKKHLANNRIRNLLIEKSKVASERDEARRREQELLRQIEELKSTKKPADSAEPTKAAATPDASGFSKPEPKEEDFDNYNDYLEAKVDWKIEKRDFEKEQAAKQAADAKQQEEAAAAEAETHQETLRQRWEKAKEKYHDFDEVIEAAKELPISIVVRDHLRFSEKGAELAYYLSTNPEEAERISNLNPGLALVELGRLEAKLDAGVIGAASDVPPETTEAPVEERPKQVPVSKAPPVMTRPAGGVAAKGTSAPSEKDDYQTFKAKREAQLRAQGRRIY